MLVGLSSAATVGGTSFFKRKIVFVYRIAGNSVPATTLSGVWAGDTAIFRDNNVAAAFVL